MKREYAFCENITGEEIRNLRKEMGVTQQDFADLLGCSKPTVERMERSAKDVTGPIALLTQILTQHPELLQEYEIPRQQLQVRMVYMYRAQPCTLIDADFREQKVQIHNYIRNVQFTAFGAKAEPTFEEFEDFLKSRCFPETRENLQLILKDLNLPFYDPMMIIEKTEGRMAEDDFWIKMEKE